MRKWYIKDKIRRGFITYKKGDEVVLLRRKKNGHPRGLKDGVIYIVREIEGDHLIVAQHSSDGIGFLQQVKVHKSYVGNKTTIRDIKIDEVLNKA